jgi:hypothetical protein
MKQALLVELFPSHGFFIPALIRLLEGAGYEVSLAINDRLEPDVPAGIPRRRVRLLKNLGDRAPLLSLFRLSRQIRSQPFDLVFFLTVRTKGVATLIRMLPRSMRVAGVHHNPDKLWRSRNQRRLARRGVRFLLIGRRTYGYVRQGAPWAAVDYIYPGALDPGPLAPAQGHPLRIAVPGQVDVRKRAYRLLVETIAAEPNAYDGLLFQLLGDGSAADGPTIRRWIREAGVSNRFQMWPERIPAGEYERLLLRSHAILPLIHSDCETAERFQTLKTSGAIFLAHRYGLPLVLENGFRRDDGEYDSQAIFYSPDGLSECLKQLATTLPRPEALRRAMDGDPRFNAVAQQERFNRFLEVEA